MVFRGLYITVICYWALDLVSGSGYCKWSCNEKRSADGFSAVCFRIPRIYSHRWCCWILWKFNFSFFWGMPKRTVQSAFPPTMNESLRAYSWLYVWRIFVVVGIGHMQGKLLNLYAVFSVTVFNSLCWSSWIGFTTLSLSSLIQILTSCVLL